jgi:hypothetical protein
VRARTKIAQMNVSTKARAETMAERPISGSIRRKRSTGILILSGYVAARKRKKKKRRKRI